MVEIKRRVYANEGYRVIKTVDTVAEAIDYIANVRYYCKDADLIYTVCREFCWSY